MSVFTDIHTHTERLDMSQDKRDIVDPNWDRIHKTHYAVESPNTVTSSYSPAEPPYNVTASYYNPYDKDVPNAKLFAAADEDAKEAMEEAFNLKPNTIKQKVDSEVGGSPEILASYENHVKRLGQDTVGRENISERLKKNAGIHKDFASKMANFPKHLSYEGSVVLCVMLSMKEVVYPHLANLPSSDQSLIRSLILKNTNVDLGIFEARFDENKDFIITFSTPPIYDDGVVLTMINSVAHPRPEDLKGTGVVPVEKDGDKIEVGGKIILNRKGIERLIGIDNKPKPNSEEDPLPRRHPVAGRNAFEIREDVVGKAMEIVEWSSLKKGDRNPDVITDEVLRIASKLYKFVENKR